MTQGCEAWRRQSLPERSRQKLSRGCGTRVGKDEVRLWREELLSDAVYETRLVACYWYSECFRLARKASAPTVALLWKRAQICFPVWFGKTRILKLGRFHRGSWRGIGSAVPICCLCTKTCVVGLTLPCSVRFRGNDSVQQGYVVWFQHRASERLRLLASWLRFDLRFAFSSAS